LRRIKPLSVIMRQKIQVWPHAPDNGSFPVMISPDHAAMFWKTPVSEWVRSLSSTDIGLASDAASKRLREIGPNAVSARARWAFLKKLWRRATEPVVIILVAAALVSLAIGDRVGFWMILVILLLSISLDFLQEHKADKAADDLKRSVSIKADVLRDGRLQAIDAELIVPGDVVELRAGDLVPADGLVLSASELHINQAQLTGEPYPVRKSPGISAGDDVSDAANALFKGSSVVSGTGQMLVISTGARTQFGSIAKALTKDEPPTAFERDMHRFGLFIVKLTGGLIVFVLLAHLAVARPLAESFLFVLALAVGLTPELLPMITTVSLARGAMRLAKGGVIVKRLTALHSLAAMDVFCTDKTGTLTEARITLVRHIREDGEDDAAVFRLAWLNSHFETGVRSALDDAILAHGTPEDVSECLRLDEAPFDFERRRISVLVGDGQTRLLIVKGAPEDVIAHCRSVEHRDLSTKEMTDDDRSKLLALHDGLAADGHRLLGVAWKAMPPDCTSCGIADEDDLVFAGFAVFLDPPKPSARLAIDHLKSAGVAVKVVSGDNEHVVAHVARALGLADGPILTGRDIAALDDHALQARVDGTSLFCRVDPAQKTRVIAALCARGHTVGYMGDGINDAPSLRAADVGLSVEDAVDVAKDAADLILTRPDLDIVAASVLEGRRTFANVMKYVLMGTSSNFGNMISMAAASLFLPFLPMLPIQILLNNLIYDASESGIPFDTVNAKDLSLPQLWDIAALRRFTLIMGGLSSAFDLALFAMMKLVFETTPEVFRTAWFLESMATQILVIFVIRTKGSLFASKPHPLLVISSLAALAAAMAIPVSPLGAWFGFVPIGWPLMAALFSVAVAYLLLAETLKRKAQPTRPMRLGPSLPRTPATH
jgi:P-type Mg2+ transporter